jgi:hypothetical protein
MQASLEVLSEFDAELAASVRGALHMSRKEYRELLRAGGYSEDLSRSSYMRWQVKNELVTQVEWHFGALAEVGSLHHPGCLLSDPLLRSLLQLFSPVPAARLPCVHLLAAVLYADLLSFIIW